MSGYSPPLLCHFLDSSLFILSQDHPHLFASAHHSQSISEAWIWKLRISFFHYSLFVFKNKNYWGVFWGGGNIIPSSLSIWPLITVNIAIAFWRMIELNLYMKIKQSFYNKTLFSNIVTFIGHEVFKHFSFHGLAAVQVHS